MSFRGLLQTTIHLGALLLLPYAAIAQQEPITANQVVSRYMEAIGASRFSTIATLVESGELYGNLTNFWQGSRSPVQSQKQERGTFESYFQSPNLRISSSLTETNRVIEMEGCDGRVAWYIDSFLKRTELKPEPGSKGECREGFSEAQPGLQGPNVRMRLVKKKEVGGRMVWEVKVDNPKSPGAETYYFDAETFLLLRFEKLSIRVTYSDYRDMDGIKIPFTVIREFTNSKIVTTVREVKINARIDNARFAEPEVRGGRVVLNPSAGAKNDTPDVPKMASALPLAGETSSPSPTESPDPNTPGSVVEVNFPNFTSCTIEDLQLAVPELKGLKPSSDQGELAALLEKVGAKTLEVARNTPNLISRESVSESQEGTAETRRDYDYLILARIEGNTVALDEFRLDLKSGDKFQTNDALKKEFWDDLRRASDEIEISKRRPMSQGFAASWLHFYPPNRKRATYRYLGEQKRDGHRTLVLAFAQKPASVILPAIFRYRDKTAPMFLQGIAWIDPSDFRILRLRTDLLSPIPEVSLHRLTTDTQFALTRIEEVPSPLQLPGQVTVTTAVAGSTIREIHEYSEYRLFRAHSRLVLNP